MLRTMRDTSSGSANRNQPGYSSFRTAASMAIGLAGFLILVPAGFLFLLSRLWPADLHPGAAHGAVCALLAAAGLGLDGLALREFLRAGRGTQMPFTPTRNLVTTGPFRYLRNPILLGVSAYYLAVAALPFGWGAGALVFLASLLGGGIHYRVFEEPRLAARFGDPYRDYRERTPFLLPRLRNRAGR